MEATEPFNYSLPVLAVWYLLPPLLLLLRYCKKSPLPTWASCVLFTLMGWGLILWATMLRFDYLYEYASFVPEEQQQEVWDEWAADGGPKMMALFGGWLYALVYFWLCWGILRIFKMVKNKLYNTISSS